jgi:hypothetical protein
LNKINIKKEIKWTKIYQAIFYQQTYWNIMKLSKSRIKKIRQRQKLEKVIRKDRKMNLETGGIYESEITEFLQPKEIKNLFLTYLEELGYKEDFIEWLQTINYEDFQDRE